jgi:hypothetical protein
VVSDSFTGLGLAQLAFGVIGVLAISSEYATGLIRTTFGAVPRRRAVLAAKAAVVGVVTLRIGRFTLDGAAQQMIAQHPHAGYFSAGPSFGICAAYAVVAIAAAALVITRRDA